MDIGAEVWVMEKRMKHIWFSINFSKSEIKGDFLEKLLNAKPLHLLLGLSTVGNDLTLLKFDFMRLSSIVLV